MSQRRKFSAEFKDEAVQLVVQSGRPVAVVARELGIHDGTLGNWVNAWKKDHPEKEEALTVVERSRLREVEEENRRLKMENEFLKKAAAFFAKIQA
jgi:transposase-like protein